MDTIAKKCANKIVRKLIHRIYKKVLQAHAKKKFLKKCHVVIINLLNVAYLLKHTTKVFSVEKFVRLLSTAGIQTRYFVTLSKITNAFINARKN